MFLLYLALFAYYFIMAYMAWLNLIIINVWKLSVLRRWKISEKIWYRLNNIYGWLTPILWFFIAFIIELAITKGNSENVDEDLLHKIEYTIISK